MVDHTGQKYNKLTVLSEFKKDGIWYLRCQCECGRIKSILKWCVKSGNTKSCGAKGCMVYRKDKIQIGKKYGLLTVLSVHKKGKEWYCVCQCECGKVKTIKRINVMYGYSQTCGKYECRLKQFDMQGKQKDYWGVTDCTGQKINAFTVLSQFRKNNTWYLSCQCECGRIREYERAYFLHGKGIQTCGSTECRRKYFQGDRPFDLTGRKFGRLTVIKLDKEVPVKYEKKRITIIRYWLCKCKCGKTYIVSSAKLLRGSANSCGCLEKERRSKQAKDALFCRTVAENSNAFVVIVNMGYKADGRKIGVTFSKHSRRWSAQVVFQGKNKYYGFDTYEEALEKRLEIQRKILIPYVRRNKKLFPKNFDFNYWINLNKDVKFDSSKYAEEIIAGNKRQPVAKFGGKGF